MHFYAAYCAALRCGHCIAAAKGGRAYQDPSAAQQALGHLALQHIDSRDRSKTRARHLVRHAQLALSIYRQLQGAYINGLRGI